MSCCGQKREAQVNAVPPVARVVGRPQAPAAARQAPIAAGPTVTLRFRDRSTMVVHAPSGKRYQFHGAGSMQAIDKSDAESLLASGMFERVWG